MIISTEIQVNHLRIRTLTAGRGDKVIIFIHGNSQDAESWNFQLSDSALSEKFRLIAIDLPGHGQSTWCTDNDTAYQPGEMAKTIISFINEKRISNYILVGVSFGTNIIGEITSPPAGCRGIVLGGCSLLGDSYPLNDVFQPVDALPVTLMPTVSDPDLDHFCRLVAFNNPAISEGYAASFRKTDPRFRSDLANAVMQGKLTDEINNIQSFRLPVLVIYGEEEKLVRITYLGNELPLWKGKKHVIAQAGHLVNQEKPTDFNALLLAFAVEVFK